MVMQSTRPSVKTAANSAKRMVLSPNFGLDQRVANFYAGPGALPLPVLKRIHKEFFNYDGTGMSVMEISHRAPEIVAIIEDGAERIKRLMNLGDDFEVVFLQGGGSMQFLMAPMNFSSPGDRIDYIDTGYWAEKAIKAAKGLGRDLEIVASSADRQHTYVPNLADVQLRDGAKYVHLCSNNTVVGTQFQKFPKFAVPAIVDMSSDFMSKQVDVSNLSCIYAHAQKNAGLSGVTAVMIRKELLASITEELPELLDYRTHVERKSNYHTPPCFSIYVTWQILKWIEEDMGGLAQLEKVNQEKSDLLYGFIDDSSFYNCPVELESRSHLNVVFSLPTPELEQEIVVAAKAAGIIGIAGHRTMTGCRVSLYNGVPLEAVQKLVEFLDKFAKQNR